jgi:hypothetical protein
MAEKKSMRWRELLAVAFSAQAFVVAWLVLQHHSAQPTLAWTIGSALPLPPSTAPPVVASPTALSLEPPGGPGIPPGTWQPRR